MKDIQERVYGTEMEYPLDVLYRGASEYVSLETVHPMLGHLPSEIKDIPSDRGQNMLGNGGRMYVDYHNKFEYATAENTDIWDMIASEVAGERIVAHCLEAYIRSSPDMERVRKMQILKHVYGTNGESWGYHYNVSADATAIPRQNQPEFRERARLLALHLSTYDLYAGAGTQYKPEGGTWRYSLGQKALDIHTDFNLSTTTSKPVVNLRDESHAMPEMMRMHITSSDPNLSPWATWMTLGTTALVMRAVEQNRTDRGTLRLREGGRWHNEKATFAALKRLTATDLTFGKKVELENGKHLTPLEIQKALFSIVQRTYHTDQEAAVLREWETTLETLEADPLQLHKSSALKKLASMRLYAERNGLDDTDEMFSHPAIRAIDARGKLFAFYDKDNPTLRELAVDKLRRGAWHDDRLTEEMIEDRWANPPTTTRALVRGKAIKSGRLKSANWSRYTIKDTGTVVDMPNPRKTDYDTRLAG